MRQVTAAGLLCCGLACTSAQPSMEPASKPAVQAKIEPVAPDPSAEPVVAEPEPTPQLVIGITRPAKITAPARKANREGLRLHRTGDYEGSRAQFARALEAQAEHDNARFNLACALSRLERHPEAADELIEILTRDPQRFRQRVHTDADLDPLRASTEWSRVEAHLKRVDASLERAFTQGVPSMFYDHSPPTATWSTKQSGGTRNLVVGLYLHENARFVPMARKGTIAHLDVERRRVLRIDSTVWEGVVHSMWRSSTLSVNALDPGDGFSATADLDADGPRAVGQPGLLKDADGAGFEMSMIIVPTDAGLWIDLEWHTQGGEPYSRRTALQLTAAGLSKSTADMPETGTRIEFTYDGAAVYDPLPPGHRLKGRKYTPPGRDAPIELSKGHHRARWQSIALTPDGRFAIVTSIEHREGPRFDETGTGIQRYAVDRVVLDSGEASTLTSGPGRARTIISSDGALYVQGGDTVRRWSAPDAASPEVLTEGLRLAPALDPLICDLCG